ncbi:MAG: FG-GAP-like repeat-containing protein, partial [Deltaproteobacteria bacterium]
ALCDRAGVGAAAGDVNGDGYADVAVGVTYAGSTGYVFVYLGGVNGAGNSSSISAPPASITLPEPGVAGGRFGASVATADDVNGDGFADLVVGAPGVPSGTGSAYVYLGGPAGLGTTASRVLTGPGGVNGQFGVSVSSAGDLNGDGLADLVIGAPGVNISAGMAYVYLAVAGPSTTPSLTLPGGGTAGDLFGASVAGAGDTNGDLYADLIVGAPGVNSGTGQAYVYNGLSSGIPTMPSATLSSPEGTGANFGYQVASASGVIDGPCRRWLSWGHGARRSALCVDRL